MENTTTQKVFQAVENAYDSAGKTLHEIQADAVRLQGNLDPLVSQLSSKAHKLMHEGLEIAGDTKHKVEHAIHDATNATTKYISNQPIKAVCIAAGVGAVTALLVYAMRHNSDKSC